MIKKKRFKTAYVSCMLFAVGRGFESTYRFDEKIRGEFSRLHDGFCYELCVHPNGPSAFFNINEKKELVYSGRFANKPDVQIRFKNIERAFRVFSFGIGANQAFAQNGITVTGDLPSTMAFMRNLARVESYLLPSFITKKILKEEIVFPLFMKTFGRLGAYLHVVSGLLTLKWL